MAKSDANQDPSQSDETASKILQRRRNIAASNYWAEMDDEDTQRQVMKSRLLRMAQKKTTEADLVTYQPWLAQIQVEDGMKKFNCTGVKSSLKSRITFLHVKLFWISLSHILGLNLHSSKIVRRKSKILIISVNTSFF